MFKSENVLLSQVFNENRFIEMLKSAGRRVAGRQTGLWEAYVKRQLGIATQVSVIKVTVAKIEIQFPLNNLCLLYPINTKLGIWVAYIKRQLGITTQMYVIKFKVTVAKPIFFTCQTLVCCDLLTPNLARE